MALFIYLFVSPLNVFYLCRQQRAHSTTATVRDIVAGQCRKRWHRNWTAAARTLIYDSRKADCYTTP